VLCKHLHVWNPYRKACVREHRWRIIGDQSSLRAVCQYISPNYVQCGARCTSHDANLKVEIHANIIQRTVTTWDEDNSPSSEVEKSRKNRSDINIKIYKKACSSFIQMHMLEKKEEANASHQAIPEYIQKTSRRKTVPCVVCKRSKNSPTCPP
jgi:hypothetical protein